MKSATEAQKVELTFSTNSFQKPLELVRYEAWVQLIVKLIFMRKGSFPSQPDMGGDFEFVEYHDFDHVKSKYLQEFKTQIETFLPEIPFADMDIDYTDQGVIILTIFFTKESGTIVPVVVTAKKVVNIINFDVVM